ncbi:MAG: hypothetical protein OEY06_12215 [Gammaproteobacteria bacterium]|nr:hypothetical protein [Gammaproteobacteria bacterium]
MKRREFLTEFLGALGAESIEWHEETENFISGRVIYDKDDPEEIQDFCWHKGEEETPSTNALKLVKLLNKKKLLSIDQISVTKEELRLQYNEMCGSNTTEPEFMEILEELEEMEVPMVDEGKETDAYFIHE